MYPYRIYKNRMKHSLGNFTCGPGGPDFLYKPNIPRPGNSLGDDETDTTPTATPEASRRGIQISIASREGTWPNDDLGKNANLKRWSFMWSHLYIQKNLYICLKKKCHTFIYIYLLFALYITDKVKKVIWESLPKDYQCYTDTIASGLFQRLDQSCILH